MDKEKSLTVHFFCRNIYFTNYGVKNVPAVAPNYITTDKLSLLSSVAIQLTSSDINYNLNVKNVTRVSRQNSS